MQTLEIGEKRFTPADLSGRSLRFCMVTTFYPPFNFGGDGIGVQRLSRALAARGHEVCVVHDVDAYDALRRGPLPHPVTDDEGVEVIGLRSAAPALSSLVTHQTGRRLLNAGHLREVLEGRDWDVIVFHNLSLVGGPAALRLGSAVKLYMAHEHWLVCPTHVLWRHDREPCEGRQCVRCSVRHRRPPQLWRWSRLLERQLRHVDGFIAMSEFSRDKHREFGLDRNMDVLPYFLPDEPPASGPSPHPRPYFLAVARLERIKGIDTVIPLFDQLPSVDLLVAGDGPEAGALRSLADRLPNVHMLGRVPVDELGRYYRHAQALIMPSVGFETFGITLIEAFRNGTPAIARRIGPFPEIIEQGGGLLFSDGEELLDNMRRLASDPGLRWELGAAARQGFETHWTEEVVVPGFLELVQRAAARGRTAVAA